MERWWRAHVTGPDAVTKATAARDFAYIRSAMSRTVEWKLIEINPLIGVRSAITNMPQGGGGVSVPGRIGDAPGHVGSA